MRKKNEVTKKQETQVAVPSMEDWGQGPDVRASNLLISKILVQQGLSKFVAARKAQIGDYCDSVYGTVMGNMDKPFPFVPVHCDEVWVISKVTMNNGQQTKKFSHIEPVTHENENLPWSWQDETGTWARDYTFNFYVLLPSEIEQGQPSPYVLSFSRTSNKAGKKLFTQMFVRNKQGGKVPPAYVMNLVCAMESNDKGTYVVKDVEIAREATNSELGAAFELYKTIQNTEMKIDDSDLQDESGPAQPEGKVSNQF